MKKESSVSKGQTAASRSVLPQQCCQGNKRLRSHSLSSGRAGGAFAFGYSPRHTRFLIHSPSHPAVNLSESSAFTPR